MTAAYEHRTLELPAAGALTLGVVADTHSQPHSATHAALEALGPDAILHAGDVGDLGVLDELAAIAPLHAVRGNIDARSTYLPDTVVLTVQSDGTPRLRLVLLHIAIARRRLRRDAHALATEVGAQLVVCGHSHVPFLSSDRGIAVFNPGSCGPRRFQLPILIGRLDIALDGVRFGHIDLETGADWHPGGA